MSEDDAPWSILDGSDLDTYNKDWMGKYAGNSACVVRPKSTAEVSRIMQLCNTHGIAVVPQGGNTGLVGGSVPVHDEVVMNLGGMSQVRSFDPVSGTLVCDAGCILEVLDDYVAKQGYMMPLDLGAKGSCQIGGNVATNAGGLRFLRYGSLHGSVLGLEVVLADGKVLPLLQTLRKDNTGFDLKQLFIGSEGTIGIITGVSIATPRRARATNVAVFGVESYEAVQKTFQMVRSHCAEILSALEFIDRDSYAIVQKNPSAPRDPFADHHPMYVLIETSGSNHDHDQEKLQGLLEELLESNTVSDGVLAQDETQIKSLWALRESVPESLGHYGKVYKYDISIPVEKMYDLVLALRARFTEYGVISTPDKPGPVKAVCGYGHIGDGNLHVNIVAERYEPEIEAIIEPYIYEWVAKVNGSISAEHGLGVMKADKIGYTKDQLAVEYMQKIKSMFDPKGLLNPYKENHGLQRTRSPPKQLCLRVKGGGGGHVMARTLADIVKVTVMSYGTHREVGNVEKRQAQYDVAVSAGAKGFAMGIAGALLGGAVAQGRVASIRSLPLSIKGSLVLSSGLAVGVINAERSGIAYEQKSFQDSSAQIDRRLRELHDERWTQLSTFDRAFAWAKFHKFKVVIGSWLTSMAGTWLYIQSQPLSFSQKIVQARVWAQGLTLASLLVMAGVTQFPTEADKLLEEEARKANHSWEYMINEDNDMKSRAVVLHDNNEREVISGKDLRGDLAKNLDYNVDKIQDLARQIETDSSKAMEGIKQGSKEIYDDATNAAREAAADAKDQGQDMAQAARGAVQEVAEAGRGLSDQAEEAANDAGKSAKDTADNAASTAKNVGQDASAKAQDLKDSAKDATNDAKDKAQDAKDSAKDKAQNAKDAAKDKAQDAKDAASDAKDAAKDQAQDAKDTAKDKAQDVKDAASNVKDSAKDKAKDATGAANDVKEDAKDAAKQVKDNAKDVAENAKDNAKDTGEKASEATKDAGEKAQDIAKETKEKLK